jgi:hypothetical protein
MKIIFHARGMRPLLQVDDRPLLEETPDGVTLVGAGRNGEYRVELTLDDCERIAEAIAREVLP